MATIKAPVEKFDSSLGMYVAATWWELGKLLACRDDSRALELRVKDIQKDLSDREARAVTVESLKDFANTAYSLLKTKFEGGKIEREFLKRVRDSARFEVEESGQYLEAVELPETFWANEYRFLLIDLCKPRLGGRGWLNAAGACPECQAFFVKSRSDQRFHDDRCKAKYHNRVSYNQLKDARQKRTRRGKPDRKGDSQ